MKVISKSANIFDSIIGKQPVKTDEIYRKLNYLVFNKVDSTPLVFNVLTKELLALNSEEYQVLQKEKIEFSDSIISLIEKYFLVPIDFEDRKFNEQVLNLTKSFCPTKGIATYTILSTTDCNARCFYCYQLGAKHIDMSLETAKDVVKYIEKNYYGEEIKINWFGGEPLFNIAPIDYICTELRKKNIKFRSNMVSNAYLFDEGIVQRAKTLWNLKNVQITLDGTQEIYERRKNYIYKNAGSSFLKVLNNIEMLAKAEIKPFVRMNMDLENIEDLYNLVDLLYARFKGLKPFMLYATPLIDFNPKSRKNTPEYKNMLWDEYFKFQDYIEERFVSLVRPLRKKIRTNCCMADGDGAVMILPDGKIGKCDNYVDKYIVGSIYDGITEKSIVEDLRSTHPKTDECTTCPILPECFRLKVCSQQPVAECQYFDMQRKLRDIKNSMKAEFLMAENKK